MPLSRFTNTFAGNPLDRAADRRSSPEWLAEQRDHPDAMALALWKGEVLVEPAPEPDTESATEPEREPVSDDTRSSWLDRLLGR